MEEELRLGKVRQDDSSHPWVVEIYGTAVEFGSTTSNVPGEPRHGLLVRTDSPEALEQLSVLLIEAAQDIRSRPKLLRWDPL